jgi:hypothetical protein
MSISKTDWFKLAAAWCALTTFDSIPQKGPFWEMHPVAYFSITPILIVAITFFTHSTLKRYTQKPSENILLPCVAIFLLPLTGIFPLLLAATSYFSSGPPSAFLVGLCTIIMMALLISRTLAWTTYKWRTNAESPWAAAKQVSHWPVFLVAGFTTSILYTTSAALINLGPSAFLPIVLLRNLSTILTLWAIFRYEFEPDD